MIVSNLSFEEAIARSAEILERVDNQEPSQDEVESLDSILTTVPSARGFFVALLTGESAQADQPSQWLIDLFRRHAGLVIDLTVKNLVMSTAQLAPVQSSNAGDASKAGESGKSSQSSPSSPSSESRPLAVSEQWQEPDNARETVRKNGSRTVARRATEIACLLALPEMKMALSDINDAIESCLTGQAGCHDSYFGQFLLRWRYDKEQLSLCRVAVLEALRRI